MSASTLPESSRIILPELSEDKSRYYAIKRVLDVLGALWALVFLGPAMLLIAAAIRLDSPGPIIFSQVRIGSRRVQSNGRTLWQPLPFTFYKFRTMRAGADSTLHRQYVEAYIAGDEQGMARVQPGAAATDSHKLVNDPRVTRLGRILRKLSLDELPQFWNVLIGEMSLVGPRPPIPYEVDNYSSHHLQRLAATPGISGLWQVTGRTETTFEDMVRLDIEYIERQSLLLDLKILLLTLPAAISGKGAG